MAEKMTKMKKSSLKITV